LSVDAMIWKRSRLYWPWR